MDTRNKINTGKSVNEVNIHWFVVCLLRYWKWFIPSIFVFLLGGYLYARYATRIYRIESSVILKDSKRGGGGNSEMSMFESLGYMQRSGANVENEVVVLRSRDLLKNVVQKYGFYTNYIVEGRFQDTELYGNNNPKIYRSTPVRLLLDSTVLAHLGTTLKMKVERTKQGSIKVVGTYRKRPFSSEMAKLPAVVKSPAGDLLLTDGDDGTVLRRDYPLTIVANPPLWMAQRYLSRLTVELTGKNTTIVRIALKETNRSRGEAFLGDLIDFYNLDAMNDKNNASMNAVAFINRTLDGIREELLLSERLLQEYKERNLIADRKMLFEEENGFMKTLIGMDTQYQLQTLLANEVKNMGKDFRPLPASFSVLDGSLSARVAEYNSDVTKRDRLLQTATAESPAVIRLQDRLGVLLDEIKEGLSISKTVWQKQRSQYSELDNLYKSTIQQFPRVERELIELERHHQMLANLNVNLLSQKQSLELTMAVSAPTAKVSESPLAYGPVAPRKSLIYFLCLLGGFIFPFVVLALREFLSYKVSTQEEVERLTHVPVTVSLPVKKESGYVVVSERSTSPMAERFRLLRTNLQFILGKPENKVVLVTSMMSGEGKTFVATNLAMTFALQYKTVLVGLDIRRPKIGAYLGLPKKSGLLDYLTEKQPDMDKLIEHNVCGTKLDVLISGVIPPNPNELLIKSTLDTMFKELRARYDFIIVDSSPIGSVSDSFSLSRISDASLFVLRKNVSLKASLRLVNEIEQEKRLQNVNLVLNAFDDGKMGPYGYGYGYGYGYSSEEI
ncbi:tyrosine protein kinase [Bacteroidia bacterium]|nr:tyrosine protein kinase [Bacteroidia bacterium]